MEERKYIRSYRHCCWSQSLVWIILVMSVLSLVNLGYASTICGSVNESAGVGEIKNVDVNMITSTSMELRWKLDCSDGIGAVLGFCILYCPVVSINDSACKDLSLEGIEALQPNSNTVTGSMLKKTVSNEVVQDSKGKATITELKSYTTYMFTIASITKHGEGLRSDPLFNTTLEEAPDIQNLIINVTRFTNTTVSVQWWSPKFSNGAVRYYHVDYYLDDIFQQQDLIDSFDEQQVINEQHRITVNQTKCRLDYLESYRSYTITITACTTICSERSFPIKVRTAEGIPGRVSQPNLFYENSTSIVVSWPKPMKPAGPVDYYELIVARHSKPRKSRITYCGFSSPIELNYTELLENPNNSMYHSNSNVFRVPVPECFNKQVKDQQTISFAVRAVNDNSLDPHRPYYGQWSVPWLASCVLPAPNIQNLIINVTRLTNTTVSIQWSSPKFTNGVVRYYHIDYYSDDIMLQQHGLNDTYFDDKQVINKQRRLTVHYTKVSVVICKSYPVLGTDNKKITWIKIKCHLNHLESYTRYTIAITECTSVCSERSLPIKVRTAVGLPGRVNQLNVIKIRDGINVSWARPVIPAGPIDYYDLIIEHDSRPIDSQSTNFSSSLYTDLDSIQLQENQNNVIYQFIPSFKNKLYPYEQLKNVNCNHKFWRQQKFLFAVRAVNRNLLDSESPYYGQWSVPRPVTLCSFGTVY